MTLCYRILLRIPASIREATRCSAGAQLGGAAVLNARLALVDAVDA